MQERAIILRDHFIQLHFAGEKKKTKKKEKQILGSYVNYLIGNTVKR